MRSSQFRRIESEWNFSCYISEFESMPKNRSKNAAGALNINLLSADDSDAVKREFN